MEILKEIKTLETESHRMIEGAEKEREKRIALAKKKADQLKMEIASKALAEAEEIVEGGRKKGLMEAKKIETKTRKEMERIEGIAKKKSFAARKIIFGELLDV